MAGCLRRAGQRAPVDPAAQRWHPRRRQGFSFAHESFFLFPTRFHAQGNQVREGSVKVMPEWQPGMTIRITHHAEALWAVTLTTGKRSPPSNFGTSIPKKPCATASIGKARAWHPAASTSPWSACANSPNHGNSLSARLRRLPQLAHPARAPPGWRESARPVIDDEAFAKLDLELRAR
jgi:hypothetical protein